ncbi:DNA adenine methylase [Leptospira andrefontaineae]|uniref:DNA adenine methylase n=1 Tax=Leptospira andrefontaineae TaxID=2484976 RepID=A0A4R9GY26_9LEPT|nr:DNA adenine methylase [Leptospira andrefontaineae]TGK36238.1 DNA adenine methylase [Leptospira andrefontaineae]
MTPDLTIDRPALKYNGGKFRLRKWVIEHFPKHITYVETCLGAGSVLLAKPRSSFEVANDVDINIQSFFQILQDRKQCMELIRLIQWSPYHEYVLKNATTELLSGRPNTLRRAYLFYCVCWMSMRANDIRSSNIDFRNRGNLDGRGGHNPSRLFAQVKHLYQIGERFRGVLIEGRDAEESIRTYETPQTLNYIDLPYIEETRKSKKLYIHEFKTVEGHERILRAAAQVRSMSVISHYIHPLYERILCEENGWERVTTKTLANCMVAGVEIESKERTEALYISPGAITQRSLF